MSELSRVAPPAPRSAAQAAPGITAWYDGIRSATVSVLVDGPESVHTLPLLPMVPIEVVFNLREAVLAETKREGWRN